MSWMRSFRENPKLHANIGVGLALGLLVAAGGWEARHGEPGRPVSLVLFLARLPLRRLRLRRLRREQGVWRVVGHPAGAPGAQPAGAGSPGTLAGSGPDAARRLPTIPARGCAPPAPDRRH